MVIHYYQQKEVSNVRRLVGFSKHFRKNTFRIPTGISPSLGQVQLVVDSLLNSVLRRLKAMAHRIYLITRSGLPIYQFLVQDSGTQYEQDQSARDFHHQSEATRALLHWHNNGVIVNERTFLVRHCESVLDMELQDSVKIRFKQHNISWEHLWCALEGFVAESMCRAASWSLDQTHVVAVSTQSRNLRQDIWRICASMD